MAFRDTLIARRLTALLVTVGMTLSLAACTAQPSSDSDATETHDTGSVAIFTPSDGITLSGDTPINKWTKFVPALTGALKQAGVAKKRISATASDSLDKQSRDVQDYVVDHVSATASSDNNAATTIVIAPVTSPDDTVRQYGDYVDQPAGASNSGTSSSTSDADDDQTVQDAAARLKSALTLARENGMHVVMLSGTLDGFRPDVYVRMSTAEEIGRIQASKMVDKLELAKASTDNPKNIEILLPCTPADGDTGDGDDTCADDGNRAEFASEAFRGAWSVLQPYFKSGQAVSPSGTLDAATTADDWQTVAFASGKDDAVAGELRERLGANGKGKPSTHTRIDGILAMNDHTAALAAKELDELGYTGSAADINPSITISGIVENITGKKDLQRDKVPDPIKAPEDQDGESDADEQKAADEVNSRWPIITGYGAYVDSMPLIVSGQQWMTALEDRATLAQNTATVCVRLNAGKAVNRNTLSFVSPGKVNGVNVPTVSAELLAVSASNLKAALIDPGYITLAEAGL
ncbi:hypothetical protein [Bifidobacterium biavatii]|uniref:Periplasmic binding protein domain-containing protein n=1 Tax=Bifidobacterium biavatii DSM 23969 TaxID=1437608 RepID=A0A086ZTG2_9BIFI|nr:hypothetical protein [Bifidobacterium biavatii]KFI49812.1 hypothetical protein BBIA_1503 [Bifidobacterium biavatii DSM 23969]